MNIHPRGQPDIAVLHDIVGIGVASLSLDEAVALLARRIAERRFTKVGFLNAHNANVAFDDPAFRAVLGDFVVLPDGVGVDLAAKLLHGAPFPANLNGTDFVPALLRAVPASLTIGLLGARRESADAAARALSAMVPWHSVHVVSDGFFKPSEEPELLARIAALRPDVLLVAMGVPRQEMWIARNIGPDHCTVPMAVGALLDFLSGRVPRAPNWMRRLRLEWLFRLILEPGRLWRRYVVGNPLFLYRVLRQRLRMGRTA